MVRLGERRLMIHFVIEREDSPKCLPEVETNDTGDATNTDQETPAAIDIRDRGRAVRNRVLVDGHNDERDKGGGEVAPSLGGKDGCHHATTDAGGGKLGSDD